jgi:hypothetical protein
VVKISNGKGFGSSDCAMGVLHFFLELAALFLWNIQRFFRKSMGESDSAVKIKPAQLLKQLNNYSKN